MPLNTLYDDLTSAPKAASHTTMIILDRDGVINHDSRNYIRSPEEWQAIPGSLEAIAELNNTLNFQVAVATNQSGVGRNYYTLDTLQRIHDKMHQQLKVHGGIISTVAFCPHRPDEHCGCRKPQPGLLLEIQRQLGLSLADTWLIGDSYTDLQAAQAAGCGAILVTTGKGQTTLQHGVASHIPVYDNLAQVVEAFKNGSLPLSPQG